MRPIHGLWLYVLFETLFVGESYKILVYSPRFAHSHVTFMGHIADTLAAAGHDVLVYLPHMNENVTSNGVRLARTRESPAPFPMPMDIDAMQAGFWHDKGHDFADVFKGFDACGFGILHIAGIRKTIVASSTLFNDGFALALGAPNVPSYVPSVIQFSTDRMSYVERLTNLGGYLVSMFLFRSVYLPMTDNFREVHGSDFPDLQDLFSRSAFAFANSEEFTDFPRPITHKIIYVGGLGLNQAKPLTKEYSDIFARSQDGVVFISFGSVSLSSHMPMAMKRAFLDTFKQFPRITFLWKYEDEEDGIARGQKNVVIKKWVPQADLLGEEKLLAFVSHAGMASVFEASHKGVPMILVPLIGDQMRNAKMMEKKETAILIEKGNITAQSLTEALRAIVYGEKYRQNAKRLARMIAKKPQSAADRVVKFAEFAAEFGDIPGFLDPAGRQLNFVQYFLLDIIIPVLGAFSIIIYAILRLTFALIGVCRRRSKSKLE